MNWQWGFDVGRAGATTNWSFKTAPTNYYVTQHADSATPSTYNGTYAPSPQPCPSVPTS